MNDFLKSIMQTKLKQLSEAELLAYSRQYEFELSQQEARRITNYLKKTEIDPFSQQGRATMFSDLEKMTDKQTAKRAEKLFHQLIKEYGVDQMF